MADFENGVWRTVGGRRIFIRDGENLSDAMKRSGKFGKTGGVLIKDKKHNNNDSEDYDANHKRIEDIKLKSKDSERALLMYLDGDIDKEDLSNYLREGGEKESTINSIINEKELHNRNQNKAIEKHFDNSESKVYGSDVRKAEEDMYANEEFDRYMNKPQRTVEDIVSARVAEKTGYEFDDYTIENIVDIIEAHDNTHIDRDSLTEMVKKNAVNRGWYKYNSRGDDGKANNKYSKFSTENITKYDLSKVNADKQNAEEIFMNRMKRGYDRLSNEKGEKEALKELNNIKVLESTGDYLIYGQKDEDGNIWIERTSSYDKNSRFRELPDVYYETDHKGKIKKDSVQINWASYGSVTPENATEFKKNLDKAIEFANKINGQDYSNAFRENQKSITEKSSTSKMSKAFSEYKKEHPNTKLSLEDFIDMNK